MGMTSAHRLAQGREVKVTVGHKAVPFQVSIFDMEIKMSCMFTCELLFFSQVDGEPWLQEPFSVLSVKQLNRVTLLAKSRLKKEKVLVFT